MQHVGNAEQLLTSRRCAVLQLLHSRWDILYRESFKVAQSVVKRHTQDSENELSSHFISLLVRHGLVELDDLLKIHNRVGMEEIELTLPEDLAQVSEKVSKDLLHAGSVVLLTVDKLIDVVASAEGV